MVAQRQNFSAVSDFIRKFNRWFETHAQVNIATLLERLDGGCVTSSSAKGTTKVSFHLG
jgi:hypothetical protein